MKALMWIVLLSLFGCSHSVESNNSAELLDQLYQRHDQWQGTPYQLGGLSQRGIDCSGFVMLTFAEEFGIQLPRTTEAQARLSKVVTKNALQAGDLVFFKIPNQGKRHHVGIYLEAHRFLHASTSQGVIISDLQDVYWHDNYWQAIRLLK